MTVPAADYLRDRKLILARWDAGDLLDAIDAAADLVDAIDALHQPTFKDSAWGYCGHCGHTWPCSTARLLHPEDGDQ
jgi:hypothetical protein